MPRRLDPEIRHRDMASIRGRDTAPEVALRRHLWRLGVRYRVHNTKVPGRPDISHSTSRVAVFVDGCFWHGCPKHYRRPSRNLGYWGAKLARNLERRRVVRGELEATGWTVVEVWECEAHADPAGEAKAVARLIQARAHD